jgi:hypothetical protein
MTGFKTEKIAAKQASHCAGTVARLADGTFVAVSGPMNWQGQGPSDRKVYGRGCDAWASDMLAAGTAV